jgi:RNA polymerase-binding protein DksA
VLAVVDQTTALRAELERQRQDLRHEIESQGADPDSDEVTLSGDGGFADRSHATEERSRTISVVKALRSNLRDVDRALEKIDAGTYGTCEVCGGPIAPERLEALPWAMLCIGCKHKGVTG